jgi:hypothetical protein
MPDLIRLHKGSDEAMYQRDGRSIGIMAAVFFLIFYRARGFRVKDNFLPVFHRCSPGQLFWGVCCASRIKLPEIADQAIFYLTNSHRTEGSRSPRKHERQCMYVHCLAAGSPRGINFLPASNLARQFRDNKRFSVFTGV